MHHMEHLVFEHMAKGRNWRYTSCFLGEDLIRLVKRMAARIHPVVAGVRTLDHYSLHVCLKWAGLLDE